MTVATLLPANHVEHIREVARRHGVTDVRLFGSRARGEATVGSDLDLLIRLEPGRGFRDLMDSATSSRNPWQSRSTW